MTAAIKKRTPRPQPRAGNFSAVRRERPKGSAAIEGASWQLALSSGAKRLVGLMLVVGLLTAAGAGAWTGATISAARQRDREISQLKTAVARFNAAVARHNAAVARHNAAVTAEQQAAGRVSKASEVLSSAHDTLSGVLNGPSSDSSNCSTLSCLNMTSKPDAAAFAAFGRTLRATSVPPGSAAIAKRLIADTAGTEQDWLEMAEATSLDSFENDATAAETVGGHFDRDYQALITSRDNEFTSLGNEAATLGNEAVPLDNAATTLNKEGAALNRRAAALNVTISVRTANQGLLGARRRIETAL